MGSNHLEFLTNYSYFGATKYNTLILISSDLAWIIDVMFEVFSCDGKICYFIKR
jgi:hypothetical protein